MGSDRLSGAVFRHQHLPSNRWSASCSASGFIMQVGGVQRTSSRRRWCPRRKPTTSATSPTAVDLVPRAGQRREARQRQQEAVRGLAEASMWRWPRGGARALQPIWSQPHGKPIQFDDAQAQSEERLQVRSPRNSASSLLNISEPHRSERSWLLTPTPRHSENIFKKMGDIKFDEDHLRSVRRHNERQRRGPRHRRTDGEKDRA